MDCQLFGFKVQNEENKRVVATNAAEVAEDANDAEAAEDTNDAEAAEVPEDTDAAEHTNAAAA